MLGGVGEGLGGDVIRGRFAGAGEPAVDAPAPGPGAVSAGPARGWTVRGRPRRGWPDAAAGEVTELHERAGQPVTYLVHIGADVGRRPVADTAQHERQGHQVLLGAVVQIPSDPAAHLIAHGEDPAAGGGQLGRELLDLPLPFGQLLGVPFGLLPQFPFPCRLLPVSRLILVPSAWTAAISATVVTAPWAPRMASWSCGTVKK
jgi:hypothetical protein